LKNVLIIAIAQFLIICFTSGCWGEKEGKPNLQPFQIYYDFIDRPYWESWEDKGSEINVKLDIRSEFSGDAYLVVSTMGKEFRPYTIYRTFNLATSEVTEDSIVCNSYLEPFRDSLKIDGFHIRAYSQLDNDSTYVQSYTTTCSRFVKIPFETPFDYPVYIKQILVKKGKNKENFKIVFPRELVSIPGKNIIIVGIGCFNDEIKSRFEENFPGDYELTERDIAYQNLYFKTFPDSSKTSFVFSCHLMESISFFPEDPQKFTGKRYFFYHWITLNNYSGAPNLQKVEYTYK